VYISWAPYKAKRMEKRQLKDRRQNPTSPLCRYTLTGRRKKTRRSDELANYYVDRYEKNLLVVTTSIVIFCILDAFFTLNILQSGGSETNLFMLFFMKKNLVLTLFIRFLFTACCVLFLLIHKNFRLFGLVKTHLLIYLVFSVYFVLILYESYAFVLIKTL
jgi:hypothetical protein